MAEKKWHNITKQCPKNLKKISMDGEKSPTSLYKQILEIGYEIGAKIEFSRINCSFVSETKKAFWVNLDFLEVGQGSCE